MSDAVEEKARGPFGLSTIRDAATRLGLPVSYLRAQVKAEHVPFLKVGNRVRVNIEAVEMALKREAAGMFAIQLYGELPGSPGPKVASVVSVPVKTNTDQEAGLFSEGQE